MGGAWSLTARRGKLQDMSPIKCPTCQAEVTISDATVPGQRVPCPRCGDVLKVVAVNPLELEWAWEDLLDGPEISVRSWRKRGKCP